MTRIVQYRRPIEFHQLCAIARVVLLQTPSMTDAEWKARTRDTAAKQGYDEPPTDMLTRALTSVEYALRRTMGARPIVEDAPARRQQKPDVTPLTPKEWHAFAVTLRSVLARSANATPENVRPIARETLLVTEHAALDRFYAEATGDRLGALRRFAELAIVREADWDYQEIRATCRRHALRADRCFVCRRADGSLVWHHVIQIQHGGSNLLRNRVALCEVCHAKVHPWLSQSSNPPRSGWHSLADIAPAAIEWFRRQRRKDTA